MEYKCEKCKWSKEWGVVWMECHIDPPKQGVSNETAQTRRDDFCSRFEPKDKE